MTILVEICVLPTLRFNGYENIWPDSSCWFHQSCNLTKPCINLNLYSVWWRWPQTIIVTKPQTPLLQASFHSTGVFLQAGRCVTLERFNCFPWETWTQIVISKWPMISKWPLRCKLEADFHLNLWSNNQQSSKRICEWQGAGIAQTLISFISQGTVEWIWLIVGKTGGQDCMGWAHN